MVVLIVGCAFINKVGGMVSFESYLGFLLLIVMVGMGFWLLAFIVMVVVPYGLWGAIRAHFSTKKKR